MEYDNFKDNSITKSLDILECPKCHSHNVYKVLDTIYQYYDRHNTYVKEGYYCCLDCFYKDYRSLFKEVK